MRGRPDFQADMQRHHLLPRQILKTGALGAMLSYLGREPVGFDDFRRNGLLLPCSTAAALRVGLPLHRGPHRLYNAMVLERVGQIEAEWSRGRTRRPMDAARDAVLSLQLLQRALRRRLLDPGNNRLRLSRKDPFTSGVDFTELDAMVDQLWSATGSD
ncbi:AHH domain-containing protein [Aurantiacibacter rhizosphaerae]|uniref:Uncharacterized protein n=1 Tax=Aurantiacibacter rhizosphaerae TaxID=2691582 RepID=A0A844XDN9_9SPHN|nr:AHH domain-containing protein [Aurantiacibacter rhizosphaerae]MWV28126.1 hypothetical protein [Aurantiacibacter rhizosphaerae]